MKPRKKHLWKGWIFDGTHIRDSWGNSFTEESIRKLQGRKIPESWHGWSFHDDLLYDPAGVPYKKRRNSRNCFYENHCAEHYRKYTFNCQSQRATRSQNQRANPRNKNKGSVWGERRMFQGESKLSPLLSKQAQPSNHG